MSNNNSQQPFTGIAVTLPFSGGLVSFPHLEDFVYTPLTDWTNFLRGWLSPQMNFGCNVDDRDIESHVLERVGSYGSQLNKIIDALNVLADHAMSSESGFSDEQRRILTRFTQLAANASSASDAYEQSQADTATSRLRTMARDLAEVKEKDASSFVEICDLFRAALAPR